MFRSYHHGHSIALGAILLLLVERNGWLLAGAGMAVFCAGVATGRLWLVWAGVLSRLRHRPAAWTVRR